MMGRMLKELFSAQENGAKAFPYRIELTDAGGPLYYGSAPASYNDYGGQTASGGRIASPISQREARQHMQTYGGTEAIDWLMNAVSFTAQAAASAAWHFEDGTKKLVVAKKPTDPSDIGEAPPMLVKLFQEPNPFMDWSELCEVSLIDWLLVGNAYWVKWQVNADGQPLALYRMCPEYVKIRPGRFGPEKYLYRLPGAREDVEFDPEQVMHFKRTNPLNPYYGVGIVKGGSRALDMELALTRTMASYYEKQALPSGVVQTERRVPKDVFNKLKMQLRSFYGGGDNAGQLMVLEAGLKYQTISPSAGDALFQQMGVWSRDRILAMFNLNKGLLGIQDAVGDPKLADWQLLFDRKTMMPVTQKFAKAVTRGLVQPGWGLDFKIDYEEMQQPDQVLKRAQTVAAIPGIKVREVREAAGYPPVGDPKVDEFVLNLPGPNLDATGQGGTPDRNLKSEPGRPPVASNVPGFGAVAPPAAKPAGKAEGVLPDGWAKGMTLEEQLELIDQHAKALPPADHVHIGELSGDHVIPPQDTLHPRRTSEIDVLVADTQKQLADAAHALERGLLDANEGKAEGTAYQRIKNSKVWTTFRDKVATILEDAAQAALSLANMHHSSNGLDPSDIDYEAEARSIVYRKDGGIASLVSTIKQAVLDKVLTAQRAGKVSDIEAEIRKQIEAWQTGNAEAIAVDTATLGYNEGTLAVAQANGATHVLVSDGEDFDEPCKAANGQTWTIEDARSNPQQHPRCKRAFVPLIGVA